MGKILATLGQFGGISCHEKECPFGRECANHETAGDHRSEGGFSPELSVHLPEGHESMGVLPGGPKIPLDVHCATRFRNPVYERFATVPINHDELNRGEVYYKDGKMKSFDYYEQEREYDYRERDDSWYDDYER